MPLFGDMIPIDQNYPEFECFGLGEDGLKSYLASQKAKFDEFRTTYRGETGVGWDSVDQIDSILRLEHPSDFLTNISAAAYSEWRRETDPLRRAILNRHSIIIDIGRFYALRSRSISGIVAGCFRKYNKFMEFELEAKHFKNPNAVGGKYYVREIENINEFHRRIEEYIDQDRKIIHESYGKSSAFWATRFGNQNLCPRGAAQIFRFALAKSYKKDQSTNKFAYFRGFAPHSCRYIVATSVLKTTRDINLTAKAIHTSAFTAAKFYVRYGGHWLDEDLKRYVADWLSSEVRYLSGGKSSRQKREATRWDLDSDF
ncbi:hypothetical protein [Bosea sp. F3-2]|uniref:hypothetical protein n=1 Tax=Bosea sp. F3-2 TaxID=2599640 RepID=UPI0016557DDB|nr:hypothetical protein [Bosea sp. F3-2]